MYLGVPTAKKYLNPLSNHWCSNPLNFHQHPSAPKVAMVTNIRLAAAGSCSFPTEQNLAKSCFRKWIGSGVQKYIILADYRMFWTVTLIARSASGDWRSSSIFPLPDTVDSAPSFPWHNWVSAWLNLHVRASDYHWCPIIDCLLYMYKCLKHAFSINVNYPLLN